MKNLSTRLTRLESLVPRPASEQTDLFQRIDELAARYRAGRIEREMLPYTDVIRSIVARQP